MKNLCIFLIVLLVGCAKTPEIITLNGSTMGTYYAVKVVDDGRGAAKGLGASVKEKLDEVNAVFSTYLADSEVSRLNQMKAGEKVKVSQEMESLLRQSREIWEKTEGYFDVTIGPVVNAWGFGPEGKRKRPSEEELSKLSSAVGMDKFSLTAAGEFSKKDPKVYLDFSANAKGRGVDAVYELLLEKGFTAFYVEIGGESRAAGKKPEGKPWLVGIESPSQRLGSSIQAIVELTDMAMATSGSYRNFLQYGDDVFSHTIDPRAGRPAEHNMISVTVIAPTCAAADAYATAFMAMGPEKALKAAEKLGLAAYFLVKKGEEVDIMRSKSFTPFLKGAPQ